MEFYADMKNCSLLVDGSYKYRLTSNVRNFQNGLRQSNEVVYTIPGKFPYMPAPFPAGKWKITGVVWQKDKDGRDVFNYNTYGPCKIITDAFQLVPVWKLDDEGDYLCETDQLVRDTCYWFHYSVSSTTLGCGRISTPDDAILLGKMIDLALGKGESCPLEVVW